MGRAITGAGYPIKAGKEPFHIFRLAVRAMNAVFRRCSEDQLFKFGFAFQTFIFKYGHAYLVFVNAMMLAQMDGKAVCSRQSLVASR